jgi:hypothetical protein
MFNVPKKRCKEDHDFGCLLNFYWLWHSHCNVPKPRCKEHHGFGCLLNFYWLWHSVKHFADLLVYMCLLAGWPLDFGLRV